MTRFAAAAIAVIAWTASTTPIASADRIAPEVQAKADALFEMGQGFYNAGRFQAAIPLFQEAYELVHDPVFLFNIAQSYRKVLDCVKSFDHYTRYLGEATDATPKTRELVQGWLRELQPCVEERQREQEAAKRAEEAEAVERQRKADELARQQRQPVLVEVDRGRTLRIVGLATVGLGAVGMTVAALYSQRGSSLRDELATTCMLGCDWSDPTLVAKDDEGRRANTRATIAWIGGGSAALLGTVLYVYGRSRLETVRVTPTEGGATVSAAGSF